MSLPHYEISEVDAILLKGEKIIIPHKLRENLLQFSDTGQTQSKRLNGSTCNSSVTYATL